MPPLTNSDSISIFVHTFQITLVTFSVAMTCKNDILGPNSTSINNSDKYYKQMLIAHCVSINHIVNVLNFAPIPMVPHCFGFHFPSQWSHRASFHTLLATLKSHLLEAKTSLCYRWEKTQRASPLLNCGINKFCSKLQFFPRVARSRLPAGHWPCPFYWLNPASRGLARREGQARSVRLSPFLVPRVFFVCVPRDDGHSCSPWI